METKTIADLKQKLIDAINNIDTSKITLADLKLLAETVGVISNIDDKPFDIMDAFSKVSSLSLGTKTAILSDLKGVE